MISWWLRKNKSLLNTTFSTILDIVGNIDIGSFVRLFSHNSNNMSTEYNK